ncbi:MAG TPA: B12-binding domain-containing radical SAM protein [Desulfotignum sp.]|nr:B12-binding domain-containing radical SAM protein [Desulfotignum sp.]
MKTKPRPMADPPHVLCVNPWIHDFAAFDFWLKPLGLLGIAAILRDAGMRVSYIDCLDRFHPKENQLVKTAWDGRGPFRKTPISLANALPPLDGPLPRMPKTFSRYGILPEWFKKDLESLDRPDLVLVTSLMTYWATGVAETISVIRSVFPDVPVILGGKYATLYHDHATAHSGADHVVAGHGEPALADIFKQFIGQALHFDTRTLDDPPFSALDLYTHLAYAPILTARGCPFSCDYCAASFLEPRMVRRSPDRIFAEISHWHHHFGVKNFAFYDDALLVNGPDHAYPLMEKIISADLDLFFHTPNALHIREITPRAADLMFRSGFKTIRLGLETADFSRHRRHDIKVLADEFFKAVSALKAAGFDGRRIGAYLLCGLPGQDLDDVAASMAFVKKAGILPVLAYYSPIPHTPMWETAVSSARFDITRHPLLTNNSLFPCVRTQDIHRISRLKNQQVSDIV